MRFRMAVLASDWERALLVLQGMVRNSDGDVRRTSKLDAALAEVMGGGSLQRVAVGRVHRWSTLGAVLTDDEWNLTSFHQARDTKCVVYDRVYLTYNMALYIRVLTEINCAHLITKYQILERGYLHDDLKRLSTFMLLDGGRTEPHWSLMVGIETLYGWNYGAVTEDQTDAIHKWVSEPFAPTKNGSAAEYLAAFKRHVVSGLRKGLKRADDLESAEWFSAQLPLQGTTGAAYDPGGPRETVSVRGEEYKVANNKFAKSAALSADSKLRRLFQKEAGKARVLVKIEPYPKVRLIVSADYNSTLKMRFIDRWLQRVRHGNDDSTLWQTPAQTRKMWLDFSRLEGWMVPIDQSAFDHHVSKDMVLAIVDAYREVLTETTALGPIQDQYLAVLETIRFGIDNLSVQYTPPAASKAVNIPYRNGVISGWQWTAEFDTTANVAERDVAVEWAKEDGFDIRPISFNAQGDDQMTRFRSMWQGVMYWLYLVRSGFSIHPSKNFFSQHHNEYLRKFVDARGVNGYAARLINRICWKYPTTVPPKGLVARANAVVSRWVKLAQRCFHLPLRFQTLMRADARGAKLPSALVDQTIHGRSVDGGLAIPAPMGGASLLHRTTVIPGEWLYHVRVNGAGYRKFSELYAEGQASELHDWMLGTLGVQDHLDGTRVKTEETVIQEALPLVEPLPFAIAPEVVAPTRPKLLPGWVTQDLFGARLEVLERAFGHIDPWVKLWNAPKSWVYDYLAGRVKVPTPYVERCSSEGASMLAEPFIGSVFRAMFMKRRRPDKWRALVLYWEQEIEWIIKRHYNLGGRWFII